MNVTKKRALEVLDEVRTKGEQVRSESIGCKMNHEEYNLDGWTYHFFFYEGTLCKIEEINFRELIECWVK